MDGPLALTIIALSLALAIWSVVQVIRDRPPGRLLFVGSGILELLLLVFLVFGLVQMAFSDRAFARLEFVLYLIGLVAVLPLAVWWMRDERSRAAAGVLVVALLVIAVMVVRVQQVWAGGSA